MRKKRGKERKWERDGEREEGKGWRKDGEGGEREGKGVRGRVSDTTQASLPGHGENRMGKGQESMGGETNGFPDPFLRVLTY